VRWFAGLIIVLFIAAGAPRAAAVERQFVGYRPPVAGPVIDPFRPPSTPYGSGNRGVDYRTTPGEPVGAAAAGEVVFAGRVGNGLHVVVLHADGIRTSYSFLRSIAVARGNRVAARDAVGTAASSLHFGARAGDAYVDPEVLLAGDTRVHLIPDGTTASPPHASSAAAERAGLVRSLGGGALAVGRLAGRGAIKLSGASITLVAKATAAPSLSDVHDALRSLRDLPSDRVGPAPIPGDAQIRTAIAVARRLVDDTPCTAADAPLPPPAGERHIAVLVGGLGSASGRAAVLEVDTAALGYAPGDVVQFSYRGGTTAERPYVPEDTLADLRRSGRRLRDLLERLQYEHPGVPLDVIAHSQGGVVARQALAADIDPFDPRAPRLGALITLGAPHHGTDVATASAMLRHTTYGPPLRSLVGAHFRRRGVDPDGPAVRQLAETSDFVRQLNRRRLPKEVRALSIASRHDLVVPAPRSHLRGADNVVVDVPGVGHDHDGLPGSAVAQREMALALAGRPPTCESAADAAADALSGRAIDDAERAATAGALAAANGPP
jgi:hypothetical protein